MTNGTNNLVVDLYRGASQAPQAVKKREHRKFRAGSTVDEGGTHTVNTVLLVLVELA